MRTPAQIVPADGAAHDVKAIVAGALEGPQVDLDALLGAAPASNEALPQVPVLASATDGLLGDGGAMGTGHGFMAGLAEQHIAAQLEQAAAVHA